MIKITLSSQEKVIQVIGQQDQKTLAIWSESYLRQSSTNEEDQTVIIKSNVNHVNIDEVNSLDQILHSTHIETLKLNKIGLTHKTLKQILLILENSSVSSLDISENFIDLSKNCNDLNIIFEKTALKRLILRNAHVSYKSAKILGTALLYSHITDLDLCNNSLMTKGALKLTKVLQESNVKKLNLAKNDINVDGSYELGVLLSNMLIEKLNLSHNAIEDEVVQAFCDYRIPQNLKYLNLSNTKLSHRGVSQLGSLLEHSQVNRLKIARNNINTKGMIRFIKFLPRSHLIDLNASNNLITSHFVKALSSKLRFSKLRNLNVSYNFISLNGILFLLASTKGTFLTTINTKYNFSESNQTKLIQALKKTRLSRFYMHNLDETIINPLLQHNAYLNEQLSLFHLIRENEENRLHAKYIPQFVFEKIAAYLPSMQNKIALNHAPNNLHSSINKLYRIHAQRKSGTLKSLCHKAEKWEKMDAESIVEDKARFCSIV